MYTTLGLALGRGRGGAGLLCSSLVAPPSVGLGPDRVFFCRSCFPSFSSFSYGRVLHGARHGPLLGGPLLGPPQRASQGNSGGSGSGGSAPGLSCLSLARLALPGCPPGGLGGLWLHGEGGGVSTSEGECRRVRAARGARSAKVWARVVSAQPLPVGRG